MQVAKEGQKVWNNLGATALGVYPCCKVRSIKHRQLLTHTLRKNSKYWLLLKASFMTREKFTFWQIISKIQLCMSYRIINNFAQISHPDLCGKVMNGQDVDFITVMQALRQVFSWGCFLWTKWSRYEFPCQWATHTWRTVTRKRKLS